MAKLPVLESVQNKLKRIIESDSSSPHLKNDWQENHDGHLYINVDAGKHQGEFTIIPASMDDSKPGDTEYTYDLIWSAREFGFKDQKIETGLTSVEATKERAEQYAEDHLGIQDIYEAKKSKKKAKAKEIEEASIDRGVYTVVWTDRDYKKHTKEFKNDPQGAPENGLIKANAYKKKLDQESEKSSHGLYRSVEVITGRPVESTNHNKLITKIKESLTKSGQKWQYTDCGKKGNQQFSKFELIPTMNEAIDPKDQEYEIQVKIDGPIDQQGAEAAMKKTGAESAWGETFFVKGATALRQFVNTLQDFEVKILAILDSDNQPVELSTIEGYKNHGKSSGRTTREHEFANRMRRHHVNEEKTFHDKLYDVLLEKYELSDVLKRNLKKSIEAGGKNVVGAIAAIVGDKVENIKKLIDDKILVVEAINEAKKDCKTVEVDGYEICFYPDNYVTVAKGNDQIDLYSRSRDPKFFIKKLDHVINSANESKVNKEKDIKGADLSPEQKRLVLAAFIYRNTKENEANCHKVQPKLDCSQTDEEWLKKYSFSFTNDGKSLGRRKHAERIYEAKGSLDFLLPIMKKADGSEDDNFELCMDILQRAFGIKEKTLEEWLNNGGTMVSMLKTAAKETNKSNGSIIKKANDLIARAKKRLNESHAVVFADGQETSISDTSYDTIQSIEKQYGSTVATIDGKETYGGEGHRLKDPKKLAKSE